MKKKLGMLGIVILSLLASVSLTDVSLAKGGSSSSSSRSSSSLYNKPSGGGSKSSSGSYTKPSASQPSSGSGSGYSKPPKAPSGGGSSSGGYSKPGGNSSGSSSAPTAYAKGNRLDSDATRQMKAEKSQKSLAAYDAEKSKFKSPPPSVSKEAIKANPVVTTSRVYTRVSYDDVIVRRRTIYGGWNPPVYAYGCSPYYGSWDSTFLWWALANDSMFFHHHSNDPAVMAWHNDAMKLSQENGELKAQIAGLDAKVQEMDKSGVARNDKYLPAQVAGDPVVALSAEAINEIPVEKPVLRVATGVQGGQYSQVGIMLKTRCDEVKVELVSTSGAEENMKLLREGKVDAAIVQSDTGYIMSKNSEAPASDTTFHRATLYSEYVMLIANKDSSIKSIEDLGASNTVYVGPEGSGTSLTWSGFVMQDKHYKEVKSLQTDYKSALEKVAEDGTKVMLFVAGINTPLLKNLSSDKYQVVSVDDKDLSALQDSQGHVVYDILTLPAGTYSVQDKEIKTLGVDAEWTISDAWIKKYGAGAFEQVNYSVIDIVGDLHKKSPEQENANNQSHGSHLWIWIIGIVLVIGFLFWFVFKRQLN